MKKKRYRKADYFVGWDLSNGEDDTVIVTARVYEQGEIVIDKLKTFQGIDAYIHTGDGEMVIDVRATPVEDDPAKLLEDGTDGE